MKYLGPISFGQVIEILSVGFTIQTLRLHLFQHEEIEKSRIERDR